MPHLDDDTYWERRLLLCSDWATGGPALSRLTPTKQWLLHAFYLPSKPLRRSAVAEHRRRIVTRDRDLPRRASVAFQEFLDAQEAVDHDRRTAPPVSPRRGPTRGRRGRDETRLRNLVRPEPDAKLLAQALLLAWTESTSGKPDDDPPG